MTAGTIRRRYGNFTAVFPTVSRRWPNCARSYDTRLGVWLSPFGGYGEPRASNG